MSEYPYIERVTSSGDLSAFSKKELSLLAEEVRRFLIDKVSVSGGHLASNLGVVELSIAMHRVFDSPKDHFIFDVGHQSYVHKILTGRAGEFDTLRAVGGLSGFPVRTESEHDAFGTGHSSTAISAALGFSEADALNGSDAYSVAVVGDGAMTGGMVHEALNNCKRHLRTVIILNDNGMSISRNIGRFSQYLSRIRATKNYRVTKRRTKRVLASIPLVGKPVSRMISAIKRFFKRLLYTHNFFEDLGILYLGPVNGHSIAALERALSEAKTREGTVLVHVRTKKGKGYYDAEKDPTAYHGVPSHPVVDELAAVAPHGSFHKEAAEELCRLAEKDTDILAVTAAMGEGTGLSAFRTSFPERFFDVGIAEEHAMTFSAALAAAGKKPYFAVYSTFLQRAYDNLLHDVALQGLPVRILVDRAALALGDGPTHHGVFDVSLALSIPGVTVFAPATYGSLRAMLHDSLSFEGPLIIRYPNAEEDARVLESFYKNEDFDNYGLRFFGDENPSVALIGYGRSVGELLLARDALAARGVSSTVGLLECLSSPERTARLLREALPEGCPIVFLEEGVYAGGAGMQLDAALRGAGGDGAHSLRVLAIRDPFLHLHTGDDPLSVLGIDACAATEAALALLSDGK